MKLHLIIGTYLLALLMTVQAFIVPVVYLDFKVHQEYIAKVLCINRDKPEMLCNGQCVLMQRIKKAQEKKQSAETTTRVKEILWLNTFAPIEPEFYPLVLVVNTFFIAYSNKYLLLLVFGIFHPPQSCFFRFQ